jgi:hypothetical protein
MRIDGQRLANIGLDKSETLMTNEMFDVLALACRKIVNT